jgi:ankyrin repeat protein
MPLNLRDFPAEIILIIGENCHSRRDTSRLSRTSQYMNDLLRPVLDKILIAEYHLDRLLIWASKESNLPLVRKLLKMGADPNLSTQVPTHRYALRRGGPRNDYTPRTAPLTALHHACTQGLPEMAEILIKHGAKVNDTAPRRHSLHFAVCKDSLDTIKVLLAHNVTITSTDQYGATALHHAAREGSCEVMEFLIDNGVPVNAADNHHRTPLYFAVGREIGKIKLLLKHGAEVDYVDITGWTPLSHCCIRDRLTAARLLLEHGANPNHNCTRVDTNPLSVLDISRDDAIIILLLEYGADPNCRQTLDRDTALHRAALAGKEEVVRMLLEKGADVAALDGKGQTPLLQAIKSTERNPEVVKLLAEHDPDVPGMTDALHTAVLECYEDAVRILLERGADDRGLRRHCRPRVQYSTPPRARGNNKRGRRSGAQTDTLRVGEQQAEGDEGAAPS